MNYSELSYIYIINALGGEVSEYAPILFIINHNTIHCVYVLIFVDNPDNSMAIIQFTIGKIQV